MSGISVQHGYLLNTIEAGADWDLEVSDRLCGKKIYISATESTNTSECRNADKTVANNLANFSSYPKIKLD